jgi:invasion protein IalB
LTIPVLNKVAFARTLATALVACLATLAGPLAPSPASATTKTEKTFDAWTVVCIEENDQAKRCSMMQSRIRAQDKRLALLWTISAGDDNALTQSLAVPAGISIKEGIRLFVGDGDPETLGYDVCGPRVCIARSPFAADLAQAIKGANKASASYVLGSKQLMQVEFDLTGFGDAYDYLVAQLS